jgi:hypothetical protein
MLSTQFCASSDFFYLFLFLSHKTCISVRFEIDVGFKCYSVFPGYIDIFHFNEFLKLKTNGAPLYMRILLLLPLPGHSHSHCQLPLLPLDIFGQLITLPFRIRAFL